MNATAVNLSDKPRGYYESDREDMLQYAAAGLPVIASPVGANTEYIREGVNGFYASDNSDWIKKISILLRDSRLRKQMSQAGKVEVKQFDLRVIGKQLCRLIQENLEGTADEISRKKT